MSIAERPQVSVQELIKLLDFDVSRVYAQPDTGATLDHEFDISPEDFLTFAERDLVSADKHGLVNALSNAKRAIDSQVDKVLICFGLNSRRNFPQKMETLREIGAIAPRIVSKVVRARNYLEHEYKCPEQEQVEDAIDIATLFVASLDRVLHLFPEQFEFGTLIDQSLDSSGGVNADKVIFATLESDHKQFSLKGYAGSGVLKETELGQIYEHTIVAQAVLSAKDKGYTTLVHDI